MESVGGKTTQSLNGKKKHFRIRTTLKESRWVEKKTPKERNENIDFNKCCYCSKIFVNSKFLIKHILRRHSESLLLLHKNLLSSTKAVRCSTLEEDLVNYLSSEFSKLREELEMVRRSVGNNNEIAEQIYKNAVKQNNLLETGSSKTDNTEIYTEINNLKSMILKTEEAVKDVEIKCRENGLVKNDSTFSEERIHKNLKTSLSHELMSMMSSILKENNLRWKTDISVFKTEIERLDQLIVSISEKINTSGHLQEMEKKLEENINFFLQNIKKRKVKFAQCSQSPHIKSSLNGSSQPVTINDVRSALECNQIMKTPTNDKVIRLSVEENLDALNITHGTQKLVSDDLNKKMRIVQFEKENLSKKYRSFAAGRRYINSCTNKLVKMREKKPKKLRFEEISQVSHGDKGVRKYDKNSPADLHLSEEILTKPVVHDQLTLYAEKELKRNKMENTNFNIAGNSGATLKWIDCPGPSKRKLPTFTPSLLKELSSFSSDEDSHKVFNPHLGVGDMVKEV